MEGSKLTLSDNSWRELSAGELFQHVRSVSVRESERDLRRATEQEMHGASQRDVAPICERRDHLGFGA